MHACGAVQGALAPQPSEQSQSIEACCESAHVSAAPTPQLPSGESAHAPSQVSPDAWQTAAHPPPVVSARSVQLVALSAQISSTAGLAPKISMQLEQVDRHAGVSGAPLQPTPLGPQGVCPTAHSASGSSPAVTGAQVPVGPSDLAARQATHSPSHGRSQHTRSPGGQAPLRHS